MNNSLCPSFVCFNFPPNSHQKRRMSSTTIVPAIDILASDFGRRKFIGPAVNFTLHNVANNKHCATHKKLVTIFTGEYSNANAKFYCLFEGMMRDVSERKPCPTGPSKFGIFTLCIRGTAMQLWIAARAEVFNDDSIQEVDATFEEVLTIFKSKFFDANATQAEQLEYLKKAKKPNEMSLMAYSSKVDYVVNQLKYFLKDRDKNGCPKSRQPSLSTDNCRENIKNSTPQLWIKKIEADGSNINNIGYQQLTRRFM